MIVLYKGRRGSGKTLSVVKDANNFYLDGWRVLTNIQSCKIGEYISNEDILKLDKNSTIENAVLAIDEIQIFFDSRRSSRKENITFSNFIQQIRKRNIILLCTTQYFNTVDLRLRQHLDIMAYPNFIKKFNVCEIIYEDLTYLEDDFMMNIEPKKVSMVYDAEPIFRLFNTKEMIK